MAQIQTANFLPEVFRTESNKKFLNATLDQLVTQPDLRNINGFVGRKFAPTFKRNDNYQPEPNALRQNYQLEASVVVKNKITNETEFFSSYIDLLQQIDHNGGLISNHDRLFSGESYSYNGLFDFDKFVNFNQYYWLEDGPMTVVVSSSDVPTQETFIVTRDVSTGGYKFSLTDGTENPVIRLAYGGVYQFVVNQPGFPFWIQSAVGVNGKKNAQTNLSSRDVLGVTNNGADVGTITFKVPQPTAQDFYTRMILAGNADLSTALSYNKIHGKRLSEVINAGENGIDGINTSAQLNLKSLIFVNNDLDDSFWTVDNQVVPVANRRNAWQITLSKDNSNQVEADPIITLNPLLQSFTIGALQKVFVSGGTARAEYTYYLANDYLTYNVLNLVPDITAPLTSLSYQDGVGSTFAGRINLMTVTNTTLNVATDIIGAKTYTSPNGVTFTNGLKIQFDSTVTPAAYQNKTFYVEGVGSSIALVDIDITPNPETFAQNGLVSQDYITINRASIDLNPWSRSNRWFHIDVITASANYNSVTPVLDQTLRASRPIVEFEANLQLLNYCVVGLAPIDIIDFVVTDSRNLVELQPQGTTLNGVVLTNGMRVVFANDYDPTVRNKIYVVNIVYIPSQGSVINLVEASDSTILKDNGLIVTNGTHKGVQYFYNGVSWIAGQLKTSVNQLPLFDMFDSNGISLSTYDSSTFAGTSIFSYKVGTGVNDSVLGFPLSYRNFNQIGDIQFTNNYDTDVFNYVDGNGDVITGKNINTIGLLRQNTGLTTSNSRNTWTTNKEQSKQFQVIDGVYDGVNSYFRIDITNSSEVTVPYFRVYINAKQTTAWSIYTAGELQYVHVTDAALAAGDRVDILIYNSSSVSNLGYYQVPENLDFNSENANFGTLTLGQLRNHASTMVANSNQIIGNFPGDSNLRDVNIKAQSGSILQHASPVLYSELFMVDDVANFNKSIELARHEYSKLKNKIIELSTRLPNLNYGNIPALLDTLLKNINAVKNKSFAWYYSDMVPYGDIKNTITYPVESSTIVDYQLTSIFDDKVLSNKAVLVYLNNVQLVNGVDYVFDTTRAGITISTALTVGDVITINEYSDTDGNYIPETPTKLGLYPKFAPKKYFDATYTTPIYVVQGHDGSLTPAFGDYRDDLLLEFEKRIFNNIKVDFNNNIFDLYDFLPGKFRQTSYNRNEFNQLLTKGFLTWVGNNRVDYITNTTFTSSNPFTWCYNTFIDTVDGERLPGYWRGIFKYFYDTDRPHIAPWEMLGFAEQPGWWEGRYGAAPYTNGNMVLWGDLERGFVWNNGNSYVDPRFVRTGLSKFIPVDETGAVIAPSQFLVKSFNSRDAASNFAIGDHGPVETAWRRSSDYPYAVQQALSLAKPAFYFGSLLDVSVYRRNTALNQFVLTSNLQRITPSSINVNGTLSGTTVLRAAGYVNWIAEYLRNQGIDPGTKLYDYFDNVGIQLAYKMAGFTDQSFIQVIAEQSSPTSTNTGVVIPNESYKIDLYKSTPTSSIVYSAVIIEKTGSGYSVSGYDTTTPYFTIIPSLANNNSYSIPVLNDSAVIYQDFQNYKVTIPYGYEFTTRQQVVDFLVSYQRFLIGAGFRFTDVDPDLSTQRDWTLSVREFLTWAQQGWQTSSVLVLSPVRNSITVFSTEGVVDKIQNHPMQSCVLDTAYNFIKYSQMSVNRTNTADGNVMTIIANGDQTLALVRLDIVEYEHIIIFDNVDIFNDVIYVPELGNRQYRLKLVGKKTGSWSGAMNPPGFVYNNNTVDAWQSGKDYLMGSLVKFKGFNYTALMDIPAATQFDTTKWARLTANELKTGLLPNFSYNAEKFNRFNDVDNPELLGDFHLYSDSAIGFQPRKYLSDFGLDEVTQAKFYQGYIRQKGTMNAINAFNAIGVNGSTSDLTVYEEWAMRVGEYGALDNNRSVDLILTEGTFNGDPVTFTLLPNNGSSVTSIIGVTPNELYKTEGAYTPDIYINRGASTNYENDIQTAGYVNINDVDKTVFSLNTDLAASLGALSANISSIGIGTKIWCANNLNNDWDVYRVSETDNAVLKMAYAIDSVASVTTKAAHGLTPYQDIVVINGFDDRVNGVYLVYSVVDAYTFNVIVYGQMAVQIKQNNTIESTGALYKLVSNRIKTATDLSSLTPLHGWLDNDKLWVDNDVNANGWAVYNKSTPWAGNVNSGSMSLPSSYFSSGTRFGTVSTISPDGTFAAASVPASNKVYAFVANTTISGFTLVGNVTQPSGGTNFGSSLDSTVNVLIVGNPGNGSSQSGKAHVYRNTGGGNFTFLQTLSSPSTSNVGDLYGGSVSVSQDGRWLYVAAPNAGNVYVYQSNVASYQYAYNSTITVGSSAAAQFGYSVKATSTGSQVAISAPYQTVNGVSTAGAVYVFDRSIETFISTGGTTYNTTYPIATFNVLGYTGSKVTVNGAQVTSGFTTTTNQIVFTNAPVIGSLITVETNKFNLIETLTSPNLTSGSAFGTTLWMAGNDADIYVASPGYSAPGYFGGIVYRYVNQGASYGTITGVNFNPVVTSGDTIRINGIKVTFTNGNVITAAQNINSAGIPGVTAIAHDFGTLTVSSNSATPYQKLIIGPSTGQSTANIGLNVFAQTQTLMHPGTEDVQNFGSQVVSSKDSSTLVVSANGGSTENVTTFDETDTTFDVAMSVFVDTIDGSGVVYVYGLVNGSLSSNAQDQYVLVQKLQNNNLSTRDQFGFNISMSGNVMLIGAPGDSNQTTTDPISGNIVAIPSAGTIYTYNNFSGNVGWDVLYQQEPQVDIDSISKLYLYNANTNVITTHLDFIDPAKGKVLGAAEADLDFITAYDPAVYNNLGGIDGTLNLANGIDYYWGPEHVTKTWWNTALVRYVNYEQGSLIYRQRNWGKTFPGSQIQVAEWVASSVPPSAYTGPGTPLYPSNTAYSIVTTINPDTKLATSTYYFWVINKNTLTDGSVHQNTITTIQDLIENPQAQSIPYASVLRSDTISLHGISNYLSGNSTVLHADYDVLKNTNIIHSEFQLVQEGNPNSVIPTRIVDKIIDSLSGIDFNNAPVPDVTLTPQTMLGLGINPNQTLFEDRLSALKNWVEFVNSVLIQFPVVNEFNISGLYAAEPFPASMSYDVKVDTHTELTYIDTALLVAGYTVLVATDETASGLWTLYVWNGTQWTKTATQSYFTPFYWSKADWYDSTFDSTVLPTHVVATAADISTLTLKVGDSVKVLNNGNGEFAVYRVESTGTTSIVGIQNGTVQLNSNLYTTSVAGIEIRRIFNTLKNDIFIDTLSIYFNQMFFNLVNYILTEQPSVDWVFKTSFIGIVHKLRTLSQPAAYSPDDQTYYESYINEVKPYRTSIREYLLDYQGNDDYKSDVTDFDIPSTFINAYGKYRSPNGNDPRDATWLSTLPQYNQWNNNHSYSISEVVVTDPGVNYTLPPIVTVLGGGGSGAEIEAILDYATSTVSKFVVIKPGKGYTSEPTIFINGNGTGAAGYAKLTGHYQIDSLPTVQITSASNVAVYTGNIISQANTGAYGTVYSTSTGNIITLVDSVGTWNSVDYLFNDTANLHTKATQVSSYTQFINTSYNTVRSLKTGLKFDRTSYTSNVVAWAPNITVANNTVVSHNNNAYQAKSIVYSTAILTNTGNIVANVGDYITQMNSAANARVTSVSSNAQVITVGNLTTNYIRNSNLKVNGVDSGVKPVVINNVFDYTKYTLLSSNSFINAADRITAYYEPTTGMPGKDLSQLMSGVDYPGVNVTGVGFDEFTSVFNSNLMYTWGNTQTIFSSNVTIPTVTLTLSNAAVVYAGNIITQAVSGATGVAYNTSTGNVVTLVNTVGSFDNTHYISANTANLGVTPSASSSSVIITNENLVDFTTFGYTTGQPIVLMNNDTNTRYELTLVDVETWKMIVRGGIVDSSAANLSLKYYDFNNPTDLDTTIQSSYTGNASVLIDGGAYYDTFSSHAPEELIPGVTYDNLNMIVSTKIQNNSQVVSYRIVQNMNANSASTDTSVWPKYYGISQAHTTVLTANLNIGDSNVHVANAAALSVPIPSTLLPGQVFINGEKIQYWGVDTVNNVLTQIRRAVDGTGAPAVHVAGLSVVDAGVNFLIPGGNIVHTTTWLNQSPGVAKNIVDNLGDLVADNYGNLLTTTGANVNSVTDGLGLEGSLTTQALFIKGLA